MTLVSRKQMIAQALAAGALLVSSIAAVPLAHAADDLPPLDDLGMPGPPPLADELPPPRPYTDGPYMQRPHAPGPYAPPPPVRYEQSALDSRPVLPPYQVVTVLRSTGYSPLGPVTRRGWIYTLAALDPNGDDGRLIIDARTGRIMRFIPAMSVDERLGDRMTMAYGPPGPPPAQDIRYDTRRGSLLDMRRTPRPPVAVPNTAQRTVPKVANRGPASPPLPAAKPVATAPVQAVVAPEQQAPAQPSAAAAQTASAQQAAENNSAAATVGVARPSAPQPSTLQLWPTQAMPDVQPLE